MVSCSSMKDDAGDIGKVSEKPEESNDNIEEVAGEQKYEISGSIYNVKDCSDIKVFVNNRIAENCISNNSFILAELGSGSYKVRAELEGRLLYPGEITVDIKTEDAVVSFYGNDTWRYISDFGGDEKIYSLMLDSVTGHVVFAGSIYQSGNSYEHLFGSLNYLNSHASFVYGHSGFDEARAVTTGKNNHYIIAGSSVKTDLAAGLDSYNINVKQIKRDGTEGFDIIIGGLQEDRAFDVIKSTNGYLVVGKSRSFNEYGSFDAFVIKLDFNGNYVWKKIYGTTGNDEFCSITGYNGNFAITGTFFDVSNSKHNIVVYIVNNSGDVVKKATFANNSYDTAAGITCSDDRIFVSGFTASTLYSEEGVILDIKDDSALTLNARIESGLNGEQRLHDICVGLDGTIAAAGYSRKTALPNDKDFYLLFYDHVNDTKRQIVYDSRSQHEECNSIMSLPNGAYLMGGSILTTLESAYQLICVDYEGNLYE